METYSYSRINMFSNCKRAYNLRYHIKPDTILTGHGSSEFGSFAHEILEKYEKGELDLWDMSKYYIDHYDEKISSTMDMILGNNFTKNFADSYYQSGVEYFTNFEGFDERLSEIVEAEYEFTVPIKFEDIERFILNGKIDLIAKDLDGKLIVIDHKSKSKFKSKKEQAEYARQLYLYSYAVKEKYGVFPDKLAFNMFRNNIWVEFDFVVEDYLKAIKWAVDEVERIENEFEFTEDEHEQFYCDNFCPYRYSGLCKSSHDLDGE